eukprot:2134909-Prymnesium_polylepis.1
MCRAVCGQCDSPRAPPSVRPRARQVRSALAGIAGIRDPRPHLETPSGVVAYGALDRKAAMPAALPLLSELNMLPLCCTATNSSRLTRRSSLR